MAAAITLSYRATDSLFKKITVILAASYIINYKLIPECLQCGSYLQTYHTSKLICTTHSKMQMDCAKICNSAILKGYMFNLT